MSEQSAGSKNEVTSQHAMKFVSTTHRAHATPLDSSAIKRSVSPRMACSSSEDVTLAALSRGQWWGLVTVLVAFVHWIAVTPELRDAERDRDEASRARGEPSTTPTA
jgi:hypothetical protein